MRVNIYLMGGDFDGKIVTALMPYAKPEIRVASVEADRPDHNDHVMASFYTLLDSEQLAPTVWSAGYRWTREGDSPVSLLDLWIGE